MADLAQLPRAARGGSLRGARRPTPHHRYMAFLSYSHDDAEIADWLHEELEEFHVPPRLVGKLTEHGPIPKRLAPIFRDRQELAAASNLTEEIEEAIAGSRFLIVLCSRTAAQSHWIDKEIACFKRLHGEERILAAIVDGEPFADHESDSQIKECFPPSLRFHFDSRGRPTAIPAEPIAADLREEGDGRRMGLLKLAAGMIGVGLDDLAQRDAQRRHRRLYAITAASVAGMLFMSGLAYTAIEARDEARDQRREAEGMIGFMLGDLREKLEPVGRLDVLDAVGARALAYFEKQDKSQLSDEALAQQWKALTLMGQIAASRGDLDGALRRYRQALAGTAEALRRHPDDPHRMFDQAQSVYFVGSIALDRGLVDEAASRFREYRRLADRMIATDPRNPKWQLEGVYASGNLGRVQIKQAKYGDAAATFRASLAAMDSLVAADPNDRQLQKLQSEALGYHADALDGAGRLDLAIAERERQLTLLAPYLAQDRPDAGLRQKAMIGNMHLSLMRFARGDTKAALDHASAAVEIGHRLIELEPGNADWTGRSATTELSQALLLLRSGRTGEARAAADQGCSKASQLVGRDPTVFMWREANRRCLALRAEIAVAAGSKAEALALAQQVLDGVKSERAGSLSDQFALGQAHKLVGDILWRSGNRAGARAAWQAGLEAWPRKITETPRQMAERGEMLRGIGQRIEGGQIAARLAGMGYRHSVSNRAGV